MLEYYQCKHLCMPREVVAGRTSCMPAGHSPSHVKQLHSSKLSFLPSQPLLHHTLSSFEATELSPPHVSASLPQWLTCVHLWML